MDPTAPYPQQPEQPGQPGSPAGPSSGPPGPPSSPAPPTSPFAPPPQGPPPPPVFQPGVASPSYSPPPQTSAFPSPGYPQTSAYQPTSAHQPGPGYPPPGSPYGPPAPVGPPSGGGRSSTVLWVLIAVFAVLLCSGAGVAGYIAYNNANKSTSANPPPAPPGQPAPTQPTSQPTSEPTSEPTRAGPGAVVTYEVSGEGTASISYAKGSGTGPGRTERVSEATLPWRQEVKVDENFGAATVTAFRVRKGDTPLTCRILVDGKEVVKRSADVLVLCVHLLPR